MTTLTGLARYERLAYILDDLVYIWDSPTRLDAARTLFRRRYRKPDPAQVRAEWREAQWARKVRAGREARRISSTIRREVFDSNKGDCVYCGDYATQIDHVLPVSRGGTRRRSNLAPSCRRCNFEKLDFTPAEWEAWRRENDMPWPPPRFRDVLIELVELHGGFPSARPGAAANA